MTLLPFDQEPKVLAWTHAIRDAGCSLRALTPDSLMSKRNGELLFAMCHADILTPEGLTLPQYIFIRGHACIVAPLLTNESTGEERFLMVSQRRIGCGGAPCLEFPAGMLDRDVDAPAAVAVRELEEETGLVVTTEDLFPLADRLLFSSAGATDEGIYFSGCRKTIADDRFRAFEGRAIANGVEGEHIMVTLKTRAQAAAETRSIHACLALCLFERAL
jgi:8-oxo-dGTP pyrophosphatase MutT (NUDIX family)